MTTDQERILGELTHINLEGWCTLDKAKVLFSLVEQFRPELCLEIGTFGGKSLRAIAYGLKCTGRGIVFGIDPWAVDPCIEGTNAEANNQWWASVPWDKIINEYFSINQRYGLLEFTSHFRKHDRDCLRYFEDESIDLVHFDSNHSPEVACRTVQDWWPKLKPGCVIIMDDIDWQGQAKAVDVLRDLGVKVFNTFDTYGVYRKLIDEEKVWENKSAASRPSKSKRRGVLSS